MSTVPGSNTTSPASTSPPAARTCSPSLAASTIDPVAGSARVRSTITIASAPSGIGAPVMMRIASPGPTGIVGRPARGQLTDDAQAVPGVSAARTA